MIPPPKRNNPEARERCHLKFCSSKNPTLLQSLPVAKSLPIFKRRQRGWGGGAVVCVWRGIVHPDKLCLKYQARTADKESILYNYIDIQF